MKARNNFETFKNEILKRAKDAEACKGEAYGDAYITSCVWIECKLNENAIYRCKDNNTIYYASDKLKFENI